MYSLINKDMSRLDFGICIYCICFQLDGQTIVFNPKLNRINVEKYFVIQDQVISLTWNKRQLFYQDEQYQPFPKFNICKY